MRWRLKSRATPLFTQPFIQAQIRKPQSSASLAFVRGIHRRAVNSPHKWPVTREIFLYNDVIMYICMRLARLWCPHPVHDGTYTNDVTERDARPDSVGELLTCQLYLTRIGIPSIKIRRYFDRVIFKKEMSMPGETVFMLRRVSGR